MTMRTSRLFLGLIAAAAFAGTAAAADGQGTYSDKGPTPLVRSEVAVVTMGDKLLVVGGEVGDVKAATLLQEYDPATGKWRDLAPMPAGASHPGAAIMDGKLYVAGGFTMNVHLNPVDRFFVYDTKTNHWQALPPLAAPLGSVGVAAVAGKIHVIGGRGPDQIVVSTHQVFDPATDTWSMAAPLPVPRDHFGIGVLDGRIHVVGGRGSGTGFGVNTAEHDVFDPATGKWTMAAPEPTARSGGAAAIYRGMFFAIGGECKDQKTRTAFNENEAYDPKTDSWIKMMPMPEGWHALGAAAAGNTLYFIGGSHGCGGAMPAKDVGAFQLP
jgi:N-acetylneuraminic acid mutarotase